MAVTPGGKVTLDLSGVLGRVSSGLQRAGINVFSQEPPAGGKVTLFQSSSLSRIKSGVDFLNRLALALPLFVIVLLAAAIAFSPARRSMILWGGVGLAISMAVLLIALIVGRFYYLDAVVGGFITRSAAANFFNTIFRTLRTAGLSVFVLGLLAAAAFAGPSDTAIKLHEAVSGSLQGKGETDFGAAGAWIFRHKNALRAFGAVAGFIVLLILSQPTPLTVLGIAAVVLIYLAALEFFGREPRAAGTTGAAAGRVEKRAG